MQRGFPPGFPPSVARTRATAARIGAWIVSGWLVLSWSPSAVFADQVDVEIAGIEGDPAENVKLALSIAQAEDDLTAAPFGYYRPQITGSLSEVEPEHWQARYTIDSGSPVRVRTVDLRLQGGARPIPSSPRQSRASCLLPVTACAMPTTNS